jgi:MFS family permease
MPLDYEPGLAVAGESGTQVGSEAVLNPRTVETRNSALDGLERNALYLVVVAAAIIVSLGGAAAHLSQDGWLALLAGRLIAQHGIPHHDTLTVMAHGARWIDQQWLGQLALYGLYRVGAYALVVVAYVALAAAALTMAIAAARNIGGTERHIVWVLPLATLFYIATAVTIRTQGFGYPLFVAVLWLLASEVRSPTRRRVYLVFPLLIVWGNLHGSVTMGVGIAVVFGLSLLFHEVRSTGIRGFTDRGIVFAIGAPLCLLATPYGISIASYYHSTLLNSQFSKLVTEWRPVTSVMALAIPFLLLVGTTIWLLGRSGRRTPAFDHAVLLMLALGGILAVRNITWFGLATIVLLPATIGQIAGTDTPQPRRRRLNLSLAFGALACAAIAVAATAAKPASWFEHTYDQRTVGAVARILAHDPSAKIFADVRFADWLVWHDPAIAGHIAYDTSFELLTPSQLASIATLAPETTGPYAAMVLDPQNKTANRYLLDRPRVTVVLRSKKVIVATKPVT